MPVTKLLVESFDLRSDVSIFELLKLVQEANEILKHEPDVGKMRCFQSYIGPRPRTHIITTLKGDFIALDSLKTALSTLSDWNNRFHSLIANGSYEDRILFEIPEEP
ncbi:MAG: hypothetical protein ACFFCQ_05165 [Promethearchaeota archaeon]